MRSLLVAALILLPTSAVSAHAPDDGGKPESSKKICKIDPEDTESKIRRRVCKTEAEWAGKPDSKPDADRTAKQSQ